MTAPSFAPSATYNRDDWRLDAACKDVGTEGFFPVGQTGDALHETARAKSVCATCPVRTECLAFAVTTNQEYGVWGGADEEERRIIRRRWRRHGRLSA